MQTITIPWPVPDRKDSIVPVFLPFAGCPGRCLYCAQQLQTGSGARALVDILGGARAMLAQREARGLAPAHLAFFGGTFTAQKEEALALCLEHARRWQARGLISSWRCSTRPDSVDDSVLARLREAGCTCVELGIQSFGDAVLAASLRGYTGGTAELACGRVRAHDLALGVQLLPGLPGSTPEGFLDDVARALALGADFFRFYPCLVVRSTGLAALYARGEYRPWDVETTIQALARGVALAVRAGVPVIRLGVAREESFEKHVLAGPRDEQLGTRVLALALVLVLQERLREHAAQARIARAFLPRALQGFAFGHRGENVPRLAGLGLGRENIVWTAEKVVRLELA